MLILRKKKDKAELSDYPFCLKRKKSEKKRKPHSPTSECFPPVSKWSFSYIFQTVYECVFQPVPSLFPFLCIVYHDTKQCIQKYHVSDLNINEYLKMQLWICIYTSKYK